MKRLEIAKTKYTPYVLLDKEKNLFKIIGVSIVENAFEFYDTLINWLTDYIASPNKKTLVKIDITYLNSSSVLNIARIIKLLSKLSTAGYDVIVNWYYDEEDVEIQDHGAELGQLFQVPFKLVKKSI